jgi:putative endonuclease
MFYVYMLQSIKKSKTYVGSTKDLRKRIAERNSGAVISTKKDKPWELIYYEAFAQEGLARTREKRLKYDGNAMRELRRRVGLLNKSGAAYMQRAFSTLEMMIAMAVMVITLSSVILVSFGNQGMLVSGQTNSEAMNLAQKMLEEQQELTRKDFRLVAATSSTEDIYTKTILVEPWPGDPYSSKRVSATISWNDQRMIPRSLSVTTVLSNFMNAVGGDTCAAPMGDWANPQKDDYALDLTSLLPMAGTFAIGSLDAYRGKLYVAARNTSAATLPAVFVFDISNPPQKPTYLGSVDNNPGSITGLYSFHVGNTVLVSGVPRTFAYAANAFGSANLNTCTQAANCSQMQVFDVTNPANPTLAYSFKFATSSESVPNWLPYVNGSASTVGKSLFYRDGYVYLGLSNAPTGPEFTIIDVHNPLSPIPIGSGYEVGFGVEAIYVRGNYAYLATNDTANNELVVLDISNPLAPTLVPSVFNPPGLGFGNALYAIGDRLYFGKTYAASSPELHVFDITKPANGVPSAGSKAIGSSVAGLVVRGPLAFTLTSTTQLLHIFTVSDAANILPHATPLAMPGIGVALDCEQNVLYAGTNNGANGFVTVIKPAP